MKEPGWGRILASGQNLHENGEEVRVETGEFVFEVEYWVEEEFYS